MSTIEDPLAPAPEEPENPTNRPPTRERVREWLSRPYARHIVILTVVLSLLVAPVGWFVVWFMNQSGGPASTTMSDIETTIIVLTLIAAPLMGLTLAIMAYSLTGWKPQGGTEPPDRPSPSIRSNTVANVAWIASTSLLAMIMVVWGLVELAAGTADANGTVAANLQPGTTSRIDINVTGQQWLWTFSYPNERNITSEQIVVPVNVPVYFNVTSKDVVHSFWVVELGIKVDANPGAVTNTGVTPNKLGTFNIRCAELCGLHHAYMQTQFKVVSQQEYDSWVREQGAGTTS